MFKIVSPLTENMTLIFNVYVSFFTFKGINALHIERTFQIYFYFTKTAAMFLTLIKKETDFTAGRFWPIVTLYHLRYFEFISLKDYDRLLLLKPCKL